MVIDVRGLRHPEHVKAFKKELEGFCTVHERVEVLIDSDREELKRFVTFLRFCRGEYTVAEEEDHLRITIEPPFCLCG